MTPIDLFQPEGWNNVKLVIFDVDGTLYDQRRLRLRMARDMVLHCSFKLISVLRTYRRLREQFAEDETSDFETRLLAETSAIERCSMEAVQAIVEEWIERRPLPYLLRCRYPGVPELFRALRRNNKIIGILSDYPANAKLAALNVSADFVAAASDEGIKMLKPHPRGVQSLLAAAGAEPAETVLIGDRKERDGFAAKRAGIAALIRSPTAVPGWQTFDRYDAPLFKPILAA